MADWTQPVLPRTPAHAPPWQGKKNVNITPIVGAGFMALPFAGSWLVIYIVMELPKGWANMEQMTIDEADTLFQTSRDSKPKLAFSMLMGFARAAWLIRHSQCCHAPLLTLHRGRAKRTSTLPQLLGLVLWHFHLQGHGL